MRIGAQQVASAGHVRLSRRTAREQLLLLQLERVDAQPACGEIRIFYSGDKKHSRHVTDLLLSNVSKTR